MEDRIGQQLQRRWELKCQRMIRQIDNLIEQNRWGLNKSMMPSYLATAQKKVNLLKEETGRLES